MTDFQVGFLGAIGWIGFMTFLTYQVFAFDKQSARAGKRRVPKKTLLMLALCGGGIGAKLGQRIVRHKTRKQPFAAMLNAIVAVQMVLFTGLVYSGHWVTVSEWFGALLNFAFVNDADRGIIEPSRFGPGS